MTSATIAAPLPLRGITLKNRVIRSATHSFLCSKDGYMTETEYAMYETLAQNGVGTIITGHCCVDPLGRANPEQVNLYDDCFTDQFRRAVRLAHAHDVRFLPQLNHAGPRTISSEDRADVVARPLKKHRQARMLTVEEIHAIEKNFIAAAVRAKQAGCDGVQLHAAHSYLLSRFLDPFFNQRSDAYGGDWRGRFRMTEEIICGIQRACGEGFPIFLKINADTKHEDKEGYRQGLVATLQRVQELGVALVELSGADFIHQPRTATLYYLEEAKRLKQAVPALPMSLVGGVRSQEDMITVLSSGIECVSLSRALIAEPDFLTHTAACGEKSKCISCCRCFVLPDMHPGMRCILAFKAARDKARRTEN